MGGLANCGVLDAKVAADGAYNHLARVQADADLDLHAVSGEHLQCILSDTLLHA